MSELELESSHGDDEISSSFVLRQSDPLPTWATALIVIGKFFIIIESKEKTLI